MIACMNIRLKLTTCASKTCQKMYTCTPMHIYMDNLNVHMYARLHIDCVHRTLPVTQAASRGAISWSTESRLFTNIVDFATSLISTWISRISHGSSEAWKRWGREWRSSSKAKSSLFTKHSFESKRWPFPIRFEGDGNRWQLDAD